VHLVDASKSANGQVFSCEFIEMLRHAAPRTGLFAGLISAIEGRSSSSVSGSLASDRDAQHICGAIEANFPTYAYPK
jgi:hypothetical protein